MVGAVEIWLSVYKCSRAIDINICCRTQQTVCSTRCIAFPQASPAQSKTHGATRYGTYTTLRYDTIRYDETVRCETATVRRYATVPNDA